MVICTLLLACSAAVGRNRSDLRRGGTVDVIDADMLRDIPSAAQNLREALQRIPGVLAQPTTVRGGPTDRSGSMNGETVTGSSILDETQTYLDASSFAEIRLTPRAGVNVYGAGELPINIVTVGGRSGSSSSGNGLIREVEAQTGGGGDWADAAAESMQTYYGSRLGVDKPIGRAVLYTDSMIDSVPLCREFAQEDDLMSYKLDPGQYTLHLDFAGWESWQLPIRIGAGYGTDLSYMTTLKPKPAEALFELSIPYTTAKLSGVLELDDFGQVIHDRFGGYDYDTSKLDFSHASGEVLSHWRDDAFDRLLLDVKVPYGDALNLKADYKWNDGSLIGPLRMPSLDLGVDLGGPIMKDKLWFFTDQTIREGADAAIQWRTPLGYKGAGSTYGDWGALSPRVGFAYDIKGDGGMHLEHSYYNDYSALIGASEPVITLPSTFTANRPRKGHYWDLVWGEGNYLLSDQKGAASEPNDPLYRSKESWQQSYDDQWALKRIGFTPTDDEGSAWGLVPENVPPVLVAVVDSGCDISHPDLAGAIWTNAGEIPGNRKDDDGNGYVDDVHGWNFIQDSPDVRDYNGHGTVTAGIIAARHNNGVGISGVNPHALIMPVRATDFSGNGGSIELTKAIIYAVDNGARVINISIGGAHRSRAVQAALDHAHRHGVVVVAAAGNEGVDVQDYSPAGLDHIITVSSSDTQDKRSGFSNWGQGVDLAAPGVDILSLRARSSDILTLSGPKDYIPGSAVVGPDRRYYRASGTSFSAPLVSGVASLLIAGRPELTADQVRRMLLNSSDDIENPGWDQYSGYGLLNAARALRADPDYETRARISTVSAVKGRGGTAIELTGVADSTDFKKAWLELGQGALPTQWRRVAKVKRRANEGVLGSIEAREFKQTGTHSIRLMVATKAHGTHEAWSSIAIQ